MKSFAFFVLIVTSVTTFAQESAIETLGPKTESSKSTTEATPTTPDATESNGEQQNLVPKSAFSDVSIQQLAGGISFRSESFSVWLAACDDSKIAALNDKRYFSFDADFEILENPDPTVDHRICDLAYLRLAKQYEVKAFGYRHSYQKRDQLISGLLKLIQQQETAKDLPGQ